MPLHCLKFPNIIHDTIAVAVSGGPDSMALCLLLQEYCENFNKKLIALTVDHNLRESSTCEAIQVKKWLENRGITTHILTWEGKKPKTSIQEKAREKRYELLFEFCKTHTIYDLFTAHHQQDNLETIWMRLCKGSGLKGLMGISEKSTQDGITLHRPLLTLNPERLKEYLKEKSQDYILDPSNDNTKFNRVFIRKNLAVLKNLGFDEQSMTQLITSLRPAFLALEEQADAFLRHLTFTKFGSYILPKQALDYSEYVFCESFQHFFRTFKAYGVKREKLKTLFNLLKSGKDTSLGGFLFKCHETFIKIIKEERAPIAPVAILENETQEFDHRVLVKSPQKGILKPLKRDFAIEYRKVCKKEKKDVPSFKEALTLPGLFNEKGELLSFLYNFKEVPSLLKPFNDQQTMFGCFLNNS